MRKSRSTWLILLGVLAIAIGIWVSAGSLPPAHSAATCVICPVSFAWA